MPPQSEHESDIAASASTTERPLRELGAAFLKLGCIAFGGPVAHLGYLRDEFVGRRRWLTEEAYADLVALCQFLPGPASSQVVFGLGMRRAGIAGALLASACFTLPSALLMILFAYGVAHAGGLVGSGWLHGLKLASVAVVAHAVWSMARKLCPDLPRLALAAASVAVALIFPGAAGQLGAISLGLLAGWSLYRDKITSKPTESPIRARGHGLAIATLLVFGALLLILPAAAALSGSRELALFDGFYRAGSLVFGGGHVVLPMLRAEVVPAGWLGDDAFLAGYGAAQALPGPLFTFAAYLGAAIDGGPHAWAGGLWCLLAILLPAWLLVGGALPFWNELRTRPWAQASLRGANAAVVGILMAALYDPVWRGNVRHWTDVALVVAAFAALQFWRAPAWSVAGAMALGGAIVF